MFKKLLSVLLTLMLLLFTFPVGLCETGSRIEIRFDYTRMSTMASNQFAIWVEDAESNLVKTIYVTGFTGSHRGYRNRDMSLPQWVNSANPEAMTDEEIDGISGATPSPGTLTYIWDLSDDRGETLMEGVYHIYVEGSLFWESEVLYSTEIELGQAALGSFEVSMDRNHPERPDNEEMLSNVGIEMVAG